ncbi:helix-turn-helix domain-containing protein [Aestuariibaculum sediminum]|uniref:Helix-turn-helix domain-containing protein n=1 Tax=Aestuariibaculum sediminum TaxID=2770637 RepID=A0A8J6U8G6_9FLAO|nr:helix-turn-helix domain-containing protein [Aestuariibaculum sediminum]MBD0833190.1 helix-turn-helix domain-containing protein [Aestuariibaculum sediminum]
MDNNLLSHKIKNLRKSKGLSQEALANIAGLSLRTIQRIENENKNPSGDTIKRLSSALEVSPDFLIEWQPNENPNFLLILALSPILFLVNSFFAVIVPLILWLLKKDSVKGVKELGAKVIKMQVIWIVVYFAFRTFNFLRLDYIRKTTKHFTQDEWDAFLFDIESQAYLKLGFTLLNVIIIFYVTYKTYLHNQSNYQILKIKTE